MHDRCNILTTATPATAPLSPISSATDSFTSCNCDASFLLGIPKGALADELRRDMSVGNLEFRCPKLLRAHAIVPGRAGLLERSSVTAWGVSHRLDPSEDGWGELAFGVSKWGYRAMSVGYPGLLTRCAAAAIRVPHTAGG